MSSEDFLHMSAEELVEQAVRGWNKVSDAIAVLLRNRTRLQDIHGLLIDFAERHLDPEKLHKGKLIDLPLGQLCLLYLEGGPPDWAIVVAQETTSRVLCENRKEIVTLDGEQAYSCFEVAYDSRERNEPKNYWAWAWAELFGDDQVFSNPKFRRNQA